MIVGFWRVIRDRDRIRDRGISEDVVLRVRASSKG